MRVTVTLQIASVRLSIDELSKVIGYPGANLVSKGDEHVPPRTVPKANLWNGSLVLANVPDVDEATRACLNRFPEIADRLRTLRQADPDAKCKLYIGLRPFIRDFILFFEQETVQHLADLGCELSIEYFDG